MSWAAVTGAAVSIIARQTPGAEPLPSPQADCEGCWAPLRPQVMVCDHCKRPRRGAEKTPGYPQRDYDEMAERFARRSPPSAPAPSFDFTPAPGYNAPPPPSYEPAAPDFSSGGGGDFGGGGASGDY